jgi:hypothetical protein
MFSHPQGRVDFSRLSWSPSGKESGKKNSLCKDRAKIFNILITVLEIALLCKSSKFYNSLQYYRDHSFAVNM